MNREETAKILAIIVSTYPNVKIGDGTLDAWFELLGDLEFDIVLSATKTVLQEQEIPTIPAIGKIRKAAEDIKKQIRRNEQFQEDNIRYLHMGLTDEQREENKKTFKKHVDKIAEKLGVPRKDDIS